jgi:hypothetical protein
MQTRAQTALMRPAADITAARDLLAELFEDPRNRARIAALLSGTDIRYDTGHGKGHGKGQGTVHDRGQGRGHDAGHPLAGRWLPDLRAHLTDGWTRIAERLRAARPVLVDLTGDPAAAEAAAGWTDRVDVVAARSAERSLQASALLVRPDGYLAWATDDRPGRSLRHDLHRALGTWFGAAAGSSAGIRSP